MGVFEKLPYLNYHDINLDWLVRQTKKNASDNTYLMKIFKWFQDQGLVGTVTDVTENPDDTVKIDYADVETMTTDDFTVYNKNGVDGLVSGLAGDISGLDGRLDTAENDITSLQGRIGTAEGDITTLQGDVSGLDGRLDTAEGNITSLQGSLASKQDKDSIYTQDIITSAEALDGYKFQWYVLAGNSYTGTLPSTNYRNSSGIVIKRTANQIAVVIFPWDATDPIIYNIYTSGTWSGWKNISFT